MVCGTSHIQEKIHESLEVAHDLIGSELGLSEDSIREGDWNFADAVSHVLGSGYDFHLEDVPSGFHHWHNFSEHIFFVQSKTTCQIRGLRVQESGSQEVGNS